MRSWGSFVDFVTGLAIYCQLEKDRVGKGALSMGNMDDSTSVVEHAYEGGKLPLPPEEVMFRHIAIVCWLDKARPGIGGSIDALADFAEELNKFIRSHPDWES